MSLASEIHSETQHSVANILTRWLRIPAAITYSGLPRATLYRLLTAGRIKSSLVQKPGTARGVRVVDRVSIDRFFEQNNDDKSNAKEALP